MNPPIIVTLWRIFWALVLLQWFDLLTTYKALAVGGHEGNVFMRGLILTPAAPILKVCALFFFGALIFMSSRRGRPKPIRLLGVGFAILVFYVVLAVNNIVVYLQLR